MQRIISFIRQEPVAVITGAINATIGLVATLVLHLSEAQLGAVWAFVSALTALVARSQVTPTAE